MGLVTSLYIRFHQIIHEMAKFGVIGGTGFVITEVGFNLLRFGAGLGLLTSNVLATGAAALVTYIGNRYWTFRHREGRGTAREAAVFIALNAVGILIQYACTWADKNVLGLGDKFSTNVAFLIGVALGTLFRFWSYRKWVWLALPAAPLAPEPVRVPAPR